MFYKNWNMIFYLNRFIIASALKNKTIEPALESGLNSSLFGRDIPNIIGLGSGFETKGNALEGLFSLGFGFVEIGPVSPEPEPLPKGFISFNFTPYKLAYKGEIPNLGILLMKSHLNSFKKKEENRLIGVNLIPNKGIKDLAPYLCDKDFGFSFKEVCEIADYIVINLSGFNKSGLSHYLEEDHLRNLILSLQRIRTFEFGVSSMFLLEKNKEKLIQRFFSEPLIERKALGDLKRSFPAILIKIDPDLSANKKEKLCEVALETGLDGIIIGEMYNKAEIGCFEFFENEDLKKIENNALSSIYSRTKGKIDLISSGNIFEGKEVVERVKNGASAVQLSSSFILKGNKLIEDLNLQVAQELKQKRITNIMSLKGSNTLNVKTTKEN